MPQPPLLVCRWRFLHPEEHFHARAERMGPHTATPGATETDLGAQRRLELGAEVKLARCAGGVAMSMRDRARSPTEGVLILHRDC